eukprot:gene25558-biopygen23998
MTRSCRVSDAEKSSLRCSCSGLLCDGTTGTVGCCTLVLCAHPVHVGMLPTAPATPGRSAEARPPPRHRLRCFTAGQDAVWRLHYRKRLATTSSHHHWESTGGVPTAMHASPK